METSIRPARAAQFRWKPQLRAGEGGSSDGNLSSAQGRGAVPMETSAPRRGGGSSEPEFGARRERDRSAARAAPEFQGLGALRRLGTCAGFQPGSVGTDGAGAADGERCNVSAVSAGVSAV